MRINTSYGSLLGYGGYSSGYSLYSSLSQMSSVRSGAYSKALKAYYGKTGNTSSIWRNTNSNSLVNSELGSVKRESGELVDSAKKLTATGKDNLFADKEKYDPDEAYRAVSAFVTDYNETLDAANKTWNSAITTASSSMSRMTGIMSGSLSKAGITVGIDGKLSIDEENFKKTDMDTVKNLFGSTGYYSRSVASSAQRISSIASQQELKSYGNQNLYGKNGSYYGYYNSGLFFNGLL